MLRRFGLAAALTAFAVTLGGAVYGLAESGALGRAADAVRPDRAVGLLVAAAEVDRQVPDSPQQMQLSFAPIVKRVAPAVVNVYASREVPARMSPFRGDPFFERFFGDDFGGGSRMQQSLGSGVIIDPSGIIVTNYHVIADADAVKVALADGRELDSTIVMKDEDADLAVLKVEGADFPSVALADSDGLEVGDLVLAIGNPFGVGQTVTSGIVSALARTHVGDGNYQFFIQTDAPINPGNSGGALIDMNGALVGINTAIFSRSGGSDGIGFAIPSNMVRVFAESARSGHQVARPWLGAELQPVTAELAAGLGMDRAQGVLVANVAADGPSGAAGLRPGDVIVAVDGMPVSDPAALNYRLMTTGIGNSVDLAVMRDGSAADVTVALDAAPETVPRDQRTIGGRTPFSGATVVNLSPAVVQELGGRLPEEGVVVADVDNGSPARRVGFQRGDVILEVNGVPIDSTATLDAVVETGARLWRFGIERNGRIINSVIGG